MKRAILYARVSTPRQAELYSLDYQIGQEQRYAQDAMLRVVTELRDDQSGRKIERDGLDEACKILERDGADVLVVWKFDRLHRNYVNSVLLRERIRKAGKEIHYAQSRTVSGKTARERLPEDLQFIMAEIDADDIAERTSQGRRNKINAGKWVGLNKPPYGYRKIGQGKTGSLVIDDYEDPAGPQATAEILCRVALGEVVPEVLTVVQAGRATAVVVRWIEVWYVRGYGDEGPMSTIAIADKLTALQIPTPQDLIPSRQHLKIRGFGHWGRSTIHSILRQSAYSGMFYHYRQKIVNGKHTRNPNTSEQIGVPVPRIVDEALFNAAQIKLNNGRMLSDRGARYGALIARRVKCECGYTMQSHPSSKSYTKKDGTVAVYAHHKYACPGRSHSLNVARQCDMPTIYVSQLDERVWQWVKEEIANPEILRRKLEEIQHEQRAGQQGLFDTIETLREHRDEIEKELTQLGKLYTTDMPKHIVESLISEHSHKLQLTNDEIRKLDQEIETPLTDDTITTLVGLSWQLSEHLAAMENRPESKRVVIDGLDVRVEAVRKNGEVWLNMRSILRPDVVSRTLFGTP